MFQGGLYAQTITYNQELIQNAIKNINPPNKIYTTTQPPTNITKETNSQANATKPAPIQPNNETIPSSINNISTVVANTSTY